MTSFRLSSFRRHVAPAIALAVAAALPVSPATAQPADGPAAQCDALAGHPHDPQAVGPGVAFDSVGAAAVAACAEASRRSPEEPRLLYQHGRALLAVGRTADAVAAFRRASEAGYGQAAISLAIVMDENEVASAQPGDVERLEERAVALWRDLALAGHARAALAAGRVLFGRDGTEPHRQAVALFRQAAAADLPLAFAALGQAYQTGRGVERSLADAAAAYRRALDLGLASARLPLGLVLRDGGAVDESAEVLTEALAAAEAAGRSARTRQLRLVLADVHGRRFDWAAVLETATPALEPAGGRGDDARTTAWAHDLVGRALSKLDRHGEAEPHLRQVLTVMERLDGPDSSAVGDAALALGRTLTGMGQRRAAADMLLRALAIREAQDGAGTGPDGWAVQAVLAALADTYMWYDAPLGDRPFAGRIQPLLRRLLAANEHHLGADNPAVALTLHRLAHTYIYRTTAVYEGGTLDEALPLLRRAAAIYRRHPVRNALSLALVEADLLSVYRSLGDLERMRPLLEAEAERLAEDPGIDRGPDGPLARIWLEVSGVRWHLGDVLGSSEAVDRVAALWRTAWPDPANRAVRLLNRGRFALGPTDRVFLLRGAADALSATDEPDPEVAAEVALERALGLIAIGESGFQEPLGRFASLIEHPGIAPARRVDLATRLLQSLVVIEAWDAAELLLDEIKAIGEPARWAEMPLMTVQEQESRIHLARGRFDAARRIVEMLASDWRSMLGEDVTYAGYRQLLGRIALAADDPAAAVAHLEAARAAQRLAVAGRPDDPSLLRLLATAHYRSGDADTGAELMARVRDQLEAQTGAGGVLVVDHELAWADLAADAGDSAAALDHGRQAVASAKLVLDRSGPGGPGSGVVAGGFGPAFRAHALRLADPAGDGDAVALAEAFEMIQLARITSTAGALDRMAARFAEGDGELAGLVRQRQDAGQARAQAAATLSQELSRPQAARDAASVEGARAAVATLDSRMAGLDAALAARFPDYAELTDPAPLSPAEARALLQPGEGMLAVAAGEAGTVAVLLTAGTAAVHRSDMTRSALAARVERLRGSLDPTRVGTVDNLFRFDPSLAYGLFTALFGSLASRLEELDRLILVPDGALDSLPPAVLLTEPPATDRFADFEAFRTAPWLVRKLAVSVLPSVSGLRALRRTARASAADRPFLGIGDPLLDGHPGPQEMPGAGTGGTRGSDLAGWLALAPDAALTGPGLFRGGVADLRAVRALAPLPDSAVELSAMARALSEDAGASGGSALMLREAATEAALRRREDLGTFRILAFATHGIVAGELAGLAEPALVLTPPDLPDPAAVLPQDDGLLTASEVTGLALDADWVILSACNTAAPDGTPGADGLSGLAKAFFYAGSRALFVSHWPVVSSSAVQLTTGMLKAMSRGAGTGRAAAHRAAMLSLIDGSVAADGSTEMTAHPLFWAPFVVVGEGG